MIFSRTVFVICTLASAMAGAAAQDSFVPPVPTIDSKTVSHSGPIQKEGVRPTEGSQKVQLENERPGEQVNRLGGETSTLEKVKNALVERVKGQESELKKKASKIWQLQQEKSRLVKQKNELRAKVANLEKYSLNLSERVKKQESQIGMLRQTNLKSDSAIVVVRLPPNRTKLEDSLIIGDAHVNLTNARIQAIGYQLNGTGRFVDVRYGDKRLSVVLRAGKVKILDLEHMVIASD